MPLSESANRALRDQGWKVFRSSTRDRLIPLTGLGRKLQQIRINEAFPVSDGAMVSEAVSRESRDSRVAVAESARERVKSEVEALRQAVGSGEVRSIGWAAASDFASPGGQVDIPIVIGFSPFDGFIRQVNLPSVFNPVNLVGWAIRTASGATAFRGLPISVTQTFDLSPDFMQDIGDGQPIDLPDLFLPVLAGEAITLVTRWQAALIVGQFLGRGWLSIESTAIVNRLGSGVSEGTFLALRSQERQAIQSSERAATVARVESEKTARAKLEADAKVDVAKITAAARQSRASGPIGNPFQELLSNDVFEARQALAAASVRPPRVPPPPPKPPPGDGLTFVRSWQPTVNGIGYLVPNPPRGGRVNVWDGRFTVFDGGGKNVASGPVIMVRSDQEIPPGARISV